MKRPRLLFAFVLFAATSATSFAQQFDPALYGDMRWRLIGPFRAGRTVPAVGIPNQPNVFYIGVNNGGVWNTDDFGRTWSPLFDEQPTQSIGALAIAPSDANVIYAGSGEGLQRPDLSVGNGVYRSTDGGKTWEHMGLADGQQIPAIIVDPRDANRVFVAVLGHPYGPNAERGVFRSTDGGRTWQKILFKDENTGAIDVLFDPKSAETLYAVLWAARRPPWSTGGTMLAPGSGLFKSTDGGNTWQQLTEGLPTSVQGLGRIGPAIAPSDPNRMYATVQASGAAGGLYRSDDAGQHWRKINNETRVWGRADDFAEVKVDPRNPDIVYVANTSTYRSTDGGQTFTAFKGAPGGDDYHRIWINPENPEIILLASDQGATISVNGGRTWSSWYNQPTAQFYHVITDNQFPYRVYGGQQESGSVMTLSRSDYGSITFRDWRPVGVEEYGYVAPDPLHPNLIYGGKVTMYNTETAQTADVSPEVVRSGKYRFNRTAPLIFSPVDKHILLLGSNVLFKTTDGAHSWQIISPDLTRTDPGMPPNLGVFTTTPDAKNGYRRGVIYSIGPSFQDVNTIWVGTDDGLIQVTHDAGLTWRNVTPPELTPWSKVAQIEASHFDNTSAYAAVNRLRVDDLRPYIYRTHDAGKTWKKIVTGLPDSPVNTVREDPKRKGLLFAGTETGVWVSLDDGEHWQLLRMNLPATSVRDLVVHDDDLVVGTHGRSFWILDDITPLRQLTADVAGSVAYLFRPQSAVRVRRSTNTDTPLPPEVPAGQNPPDGAIVNYWLKTPAEKVTLEILDSTGKLVRRYASDDKPAAVNPNDINVPMYWVRMPKVLPNSAGMHRWVWDLHYPEPDVSEREHPISAIPHDTPPEPLGPRALPGVYTIRLTVAGRTLSQPLTVTMDPRVKTPPLALQQQFDMEMKLADALRQDYAALQQVRSARAKLAAVKPKATALAADIAALEQKLATFEALGRQATSLAALNGTLASVYNAVDSADTAPTAPELAAFQQVQKALAAELARWASVQKQQIEPLNRKLRAAGLGEI